VLDLIFVCITVLFFAVNAAFAIGCDRLLGGKR